MVSGAHGYEILLTQVTRKLIESAQANSTEFSTDSVESVSSSQVDLS